MRRRASVRICAVVLRLAPVVTVALIIFAASFVGTYLQYVIGLSFVAMITGVSLVLLVGLGRVIMLATGAMSAIGAYAAILFVTHFSIPYLISVVLAALLGALGGLILAVPALRFRGHNLAMVTLVFQSIAIIAIREMPSVTGGSEGLRAPAAELFGYALSSDFEYVLLIGSATMLTVLIVAILQKGRFGKTLNAITDTEVGAEAFGINIKAFQVVTFVISSGLLALAGGLVAPRLRIVDPESFGIFASITALAYPIIGGMTSTWGGLIGGGTLTLLPELLRPLAEYREFILSVLVLVVMLFWPDGLLGLLQHLFSVLRGVARGTAAPVSERFSAGAISNTEHQHSLIKFHSLSLDVKTNSRRAVASRNGISLGDCCPIVGVDDALEMIDVNKAYGQLRAVRNVNLQVKAGTIHGLIGPNGAGKTTLFNIICGFTEFDSGTLRIFQTEQASIPVHGFVKKGITRTFQHVAVFKRLTCTDNVILGLGNNGIVRSLVASVNDFFEIEPRPEREAALAALDMVGLSAKRDLMAGTLSLGDQRRLEIARAIVSNPRLLLLDEPMSGVSREEEHQLLELLRHLNVAAGITMVLIEHNVRFVLEICDTLSVMASGAIIAQGPPAQVIANPEVRLTYFGSHERKAS